MTKRKTKAASGNEADDRRVEYMPLTEVKTAARNPKLHADDQIQASLNRFGLAELPLLDERTGTLVAGHGRIEQLSTLHTTGATPPRGVRVGDDGTWLVPVIRGWASPDDREAGAYMIASNRLSELGGWDDRGLAELASELDGALDGVGLEDSDVEELLRRTDLYGDAATAQLGSFALDDEDEDDPEVTTTPAPAPSPTLTTTAGVAGATADPTPPPDAGPDTTGTTDPPPELREGRQLATATGITWVQVAWTATTEQREIIREAIRLAQHNLNLPTSIEALTAVCDHYRRQEGGES